MITHLRTLLLRKSIINIDVNSDELLRLHRAAVREKLLLRRAFSCFYSQINDILSANKLIAGRVLELGSGAGFASQVIPNLVASDIRPAPTLDLVANALAFPVLDHSFSAVIAINVFHHIPHPELFFNECIRIIIPDGLVILIEPHIGFVSKFFHKLIHNDEFFDETTIGWSNERVSGPMLGANQALAHNVFVRDKLYFDDLYGTALSIDDIQYSSNTLTYIFSGGVNFVQLAPDSFSGVLSWISKVIFRNQKLALHKFTILRIKAQ